MYLISKFETDYDAYMQSEDWQRLRQIRIRIDDGKCCMCGKPLKLDVHHLRYNDASGSLLGREDPWKDLLCLCRTCHESVHTMMNRATGRRPDGSVIFGWSDLLPKHIRKNLIDRGLM